jgi:protoporphyrinogen/coproporphyrinogen III oxidase
MIVIIGAGISGLTLAYELQKANKPFILLESYSKTGGYINSIQYENYLLEVGPNSILIDKAFDEFINELDLADKVEDAAVVNKKRFVFKNGAIQQLPSGPLSLFTSSFFSWQTKKSFVKELFNSTTSNENESVYDFFTRRFTKELTEYTVDPFATGVYAGDIKQLLMAETFPQVIGLEKDFGSIIKGVFKKGFGEKRRTASLLGGLQTLTNSLTKKIKSISLNTKVVSIQKSVSGFTINLLKANNTTDTIYANKVVCCGTTFSAADIIQEYNPAVASILHAVHYAPIKAVYAAFKMKDVKHHMQGFGCLYPSKEKSYIAGTIWNSSIFKKRCPSDEVLTTSFIGGMHQSELTRLSDNEIESLVVQQLQKDLSITGAPTFIHIAGWTKAIPQYDLQLKNAKLAIKDLEKDQLYFCSNWTHAISLGSCIQNARDLALRL